MEAQTKLPLVVRYHAATAFAAATCCRKQWFPRVAAYAVTAQPIVGGMLTVIVLNVTVIVL